MRPNAILLITAYVAEHPDCTSAEMSDALEISPSSIKSALLKMARCGEAIRQDVGNGRPCYSYRLAPGVRIPTATAEPVITTDPAQLRAAEERVSELESRGLYRRAATVIADIFAMPLSQGDFARLAMRRKHCMNRAGRA